MADSVLKTQGANDPARQQAQGGAVTPADQGPKKKMGWFDHTQIRARFNQFVSPYWALILPLLSVRYNAEGTDGVLEPVIKSSKLYNKGPNHKKWMDGAWAIATGAFMTGVTGFYTLQTYGDIKRQFAQPLGWEFDKPPEKVGLIDMFRSKNTLVHDTITNFAKRTALRFVVNLPFFSYLVPTPFGKQVNEYNAIREKQNLKRVDLSKLASPKDSVNLGVGTNAAYLVTDTLFRRKTFFEAEQAFVDVNINHSEGVGNKITANDLLDLCALQNRPRGAPPVLPEMGTPRWDNAVRICSVVADLMNETYLNKPEAKGEHANLTMPEFLYLLGMGLLESDNLERNLAYVLVANKHGIPAVKKVARQVDAGIDLQQALKDYPVDLNRYLLPVTPDDSKMLKDMGIASEPVTAAAPRAREELRKPRPEAPPASHMERAAMQPETVPSLG